MMNATNIGVGVTISAYDRATRTFGAIRTGFSNFRKEFAQRTQIKDPMMAGIFRGALGSGMRRIGNDLSGIAKRIIESMAPFNLAMRVIRSATGATAEEINRLESASRARGVAELGYTANESATAMAQLARETNSVADSQRMLGPALEFARMTQQDVAAGSSQLADTLRIFNLRAEDAGGITDKLAWAMKEFHLVGSEATDVLRGTAAGANLANQTFDDTLLAVGMMKKVFPDATRAAMAANQAFIQLSGDKAVKGLKHLGISAKDQSGKFRGLGDLLSEIMTKTEKMTDAQRAEALSTIFGGRAAGGMSIIIDQLSAGVKNNAGETLRGAAAIKYLQEQMRGSTGEAQKMAAAMVSVDDKLKASEQRLTAIFHGAAKAMNDMIREPAVEFLNDIADALEALPPGARKALLGIAAGIGAIIKVISGLVIASAVMRAFGLSFLGIVWSAAKVVVTLGLLLPLIGGLAAGFFVLYRAAHTSGSGIADSWEEMKRKVQLGWQGMIEMIQSGKLSNSMQKELGKSENIGVQKFVDMIGRARERVIVWWDGMIAGIDEGAKQLGPQIGWLRDKFQWLFDLFNGEAFKDPLAGYKDSGHAAGLEIAKLGGLAIKALGNLADLGKGLRNAFKNVSVNDVVNGFRSFVSVARTLAHALNAVGWVLGKVAAFAQLLYHGIMTIVDAVAGFFSMIADAASMFPAVFLAGKGGYGVKTSPEEMQAFAKKYANYKNTSYSADATAQAISAQDAGLKLLGREESGSDTLRNVALTNKHLPNVVAQSILQTKALEIASRVPGAKTAEENAAIVRQLEMLNRAMVALGGRPFIVNLDGKRVGEGVDDAADRENARNLGGGSGRTFGALAPAPAGGR